MKSMLVRIEKKEGVTDNELLEKIEVLPGVVDSDIVNEDDLRFEVREKTKETIFEVGRALYQMEDPRGGCPLQKLRLMIEGEIGEDFRRCAKVPSDRQDLLQTLQ